MKKIDLPNEVMLTEPMKEYLRQCIGILVERFLCQYLNETPWRVVRAEVVATGAFLSEMQFFRERNCSGYEQLCMAVDNLTQIGVFEFQLERTLNMNNYPGHVIGKSLLVVTDKDDAKPRWTLESLVSC